MKTLIALIATIGLLAVDIQESQAQRCWTNAYGQRVCSRGGPVRTAMFGPQVLESAPMTQTVYQSYGGSSGGTTYGGSSGGYSNVSTRTSNPYSEAAPTPPPVAAPKSDDAAKLDEALDRISRLERDIRAYRDEVNEYKAAMTLGDFTTVFTSGCDNPRCNCENCTCDDCECGLTLAEVESWPSAGGKPITIADLDRLTTPTPLLAMK